ncbi:hypothetical protein ACFY2T_33635 [Streptomyces sp. NPDC001260]|uniref:hypothetical protein n=1 Tax=Streptomyces sp. NPDC001260 TaxID=3364551 RepID=UPI0036833965
MSGLMRRYWASLTDTDIDSLELLIEYGRQRNGNLWRRYLASLLDVQVPCAAVTETGQAVSVTPTSVVFYDLETTVDVGTTPPSRGSWWRGAGFVLVTLLVIGLAFGVSRLLLPASRPTSPATSIGSTYPTVKDSAGYSVVVPQGWTRREKQSALAPIVYYDSPDDGRQLQIFEVSEASPDASLSMAETDPGFGFATLPGYEVIARNQGGTWAELWYRYNDQDRGPRQVIDHRFQAADGKLYAMRSSGPAKLGHVWIRKPLDLALKSFCPTGAACS